MEIRICDRCGDEHAKQCELVIHKFNDSTDQYDFDLCKPCQGDLFVVFLHCSTEEIARQREKKGGAFV